MLILYRSMFLPRLIYNCEAWSNMTKNDYETLKSQQLNYLRSIMELFFLSGYRSVHRNLSLYQEQQRNDITYLVTVAQDNIQL